MLSKVVQIRNPERGRGKGGRMQGRKTEIAILLIKESKENKHVCNVSATKFKVEVHM